MMNFRRFFLVLFAFYGSDLQGQDSLANFWSGVTPKQKKASKTEVDYTLKLIKQIPYPDTVSFVCPTLPGSEYKIDAQAVQEWMNKDLQLLRLGQRNCVLNICNNLLERLPDSAYELRARLLAEKVFAHLRFGEKNKIESYAELLLDQLEKKLINSPAAMIAVAQYLHVKKEASDQALAIAQAALAKAHTNNDPYWKMRGLSLIGVISRDVFFGSTLKAIPYHEQALSIAEANQDTIGMVTELISLSLNYHDAGEQSRFLDYTRKAALLLQKAPDVRRLISIWVSMSMQLDNDNRKEESLELLWQSRKLAQAFHLQEITRDLDTRLFGANLNFNRLKEAEAALLRASDGVTDGSRYAEFYYQLNKAKNQPEKALYFLEKAYSKVGETYMDRNASELSRMETQYNTREKERILAEKEALLSTNSRQRFWLLIFSALTSLLLGGAIWAYIREIKTRRLLAIQKNIIEVQAAEVHQLDELKSRFFANVSHELRTPLTLMLGPVNALLKKHNQNETELKLLQFIERNAKQLQKLINEILDLSKLEANKLEVVEESVHFYQYLKDQLAQFHSFASSDGLEFDIQFNLEQDTYLMLDTGKFEKIIHNFLSNAMKFTPAGGKVTLCVEAIEQDIQITVSDTGQGIHPDDLPFIFDRFYQSKQPNAKTEGGTGIGLSLSKELAQLLGGSVWAESTFGAGSTFYFRFPINEADSDLQLEHTNSTTFEKSVISIPEIGAKNNALELRSQNDRSIRSILIVEDNPDLREYLQFLLSDYNVFTAENGKIALDLLESGSVSPHLIISDLMMPVMDGFQLLDQIKMDDRWRHLPYILLTAKVNTHTKLEAFRIGVDDYLTKPFDEAELKARIENLLRNYQERMQFFASDSTDSSTSGAMAERPVISQADEAWLKEVELTFAKTLADRNFNLDWVATTLNLSQRQFSRRLQKLTGLSPNRYYQEIRLQSAKEMLYNGKFGTIKETGFAVGFRDTQYFSSLFQERFGVPPSTYLR